MTNQKRKRKERKKLKGKKRKQKKEKREIHCQEVGICLKWVKDRNNPPEVFLGKGVLNICCKFTGEHPYRSAVLRFL